jgi:hypothetical protein
MSCVPRGAQQYWHVLHGVALVVRGRRVEVCFCDFDACGALRSEDVGGVVWGGCGPAVWLACCCVQLYV